MRPLLTARLLGVIALSPVLISVSAYAQEAEQKGMPQLDFANPLTISQVVWTVVIFAVLYLLLSTWGLPRVGRVLGDRDTRIANDLNSARAAKAEADAAATEARDAARRAHEEAQAQINAAVAAAKAAATTQAAILNASLEARLEKAEQGIAEARAAALASLRDVATSATAGMVARLSGKPADPHAVDAAVRALLPENAG